MEIIIRRRDIYVVAVVLSVFFSWVAYAAYANFDARASLRDLAEVHIDEWFDTEPEGTLREDFEYLAIVDMDRPYEIFGPAFGVIHVYIRDRGDEACETFKGLEFYYRLAENGWYLEHSAGCGAKEHHVRAFQHYLAQGAGVHDSVIDQAIGIDFDVARAEAYLKARSEGRNPFLATHSHGDDHPQGHDHTHGDDHPQDHDHGTVDSEDSADDLRPSARLPLRRHEERNVEERGKNATNEEGVAP